MRIIKNQSISTVFMGISQASRQVAPHWHFRIFWGLQATDTVRDIPTITFEQYCDLLAQYIYERRIIQSWNHTSNSETCQCLYFNSFFFQFYFFYVDICFCRQLVMALSLIWVTWENIIHFDWSCFSGRFPFRKRNPSFFL